MTDASEGGRDREFRGESDPMSTTFYACDYCRTIYAGKVRDCESCGTERPDMTRVVPSRRTAGGDG